MNNEEGDPNHALYSHTFENLLVPKSPRSNTVRNSRADPNQISPNEFFGDDDEDDHDGINASSDQGEDQVPRTVSFDFNDDPGGLIVEDVHEEFTPMLNITYPNFETRVQLYLKPKDGEPNTKLMLLLVDTMLAITYITFQFIYVLDGNYKEDQDKIVQILVGFGVTGAILFYCIGDAWRFLNSWTDKILYLCSCLLQKPILLPVLLPGHYFSSYVATKQFDGRSIIRINNVHQTTFMLAVQESNFLYSFTLSAFSALSTFLSSNLQTWTSVSLCIISCIYSIFGFSVAIYLYGRKVTHNPDSLNRHSVIYKSSGKTEKDLYSSPSSEF